MVQTLPNYSSLSTPPLLLFCELGLSFFETVCQDLGAKLWGLRLPLRLGLLLGLLRSARQGFSFGVQDFLELVFASVFAHFQTFPTVQSGAVRPLARPAVLADPASPRPRDFIRPRVLALPNQPLPTRRTFFTLSSFRALLPPALPCAGSWRRVASRPSPRALHPSAPFVLSYVHTLRLPLLYIRHWRITPPRSYATGAGFRSPSHSPRCPPRCPPTELLRPRPFGIPSLWSIPVGFLHARGHLRHVLFDLFGRVLEREVGEFSYRLTHLGFAEFALLMKFHHFVYSTLREGDFLIFWA